MKVVVVSGGFDPVHSGHIAYFKSAKELGDILVVALNSDEWLIKKKGKFFMPFNERKIVLENFSCVDMVIDFSDDSIGSAANALHKVKKMYPKDRIYFANGGDRKKGNIAETSVDDIKFVYSVGGNDKKNSSSWILKKWQYEHKESTWGFLYNLLIEDNVILKELIINPGQAMSLQRPFKRNEIWVISDGSCTVNQSRDKLKSKKLNKFDHYIVPQESRHQITNPYDQPCHIIKIQNGENSREVEI